MRAVFCLLTCALLLAAPQGPANYEVFAVRFAHVPYALASLVAGAEKGPQVDIAFTVWPIRDTAGGRVLLVDAGFYRDKFIQRWKPQDYVRPSAALQAGLGIAPDKVTDIIITHSHWDHADGADLFPNATIWIQKEEYEYYIDEAGKVRNGGGVDADDAAMLAALKAAGRVKLVDGDNQEIAPGIRVYTGGKHTFASQYVSVPRATARSSSRPTTRTSIRTSRSTCHRADARSRDEPGRAGADAAAGRFPGTRDSGARSRRLLPLSHSRAKRRQGGAE
jgi:glyoxylase-like metal-dependent hydrolase (beta-lactamase superfamily II)